MNRLLSRPSLRRCLPMLLVSSALLIGCDDSASSSRFQINPERATLPKDTATVALGVDGGQEPLTWSVTDDSLGKVSGSGRVVTYTRTAATGINTIQVVDANGWVASSYITQKDTAAAGTALTLTPGSASLAANGDKTLFTAAGGVPPYQWSVGDGSRGVLTVSGSTQAIYTRRQAGNNTVIVADRDGTAAIAQVTQAGSSLTISPSAPSLAANGNQVVLTVSGGQAPYVWSDANNSGHLLNASGTSVVYERDSAGQNAVTVEDGNGATAIILISQP